MKKVQTQFRRCKTRRLIRVYTVCIQEFLHKIQKCKHPPNTSKTRNGLIHIRMDKPVSQKREKADTRDTDNKSCHKSDTAS